LEEVSNMKSVPNWISYPHENFWIFIPPLAILFYFLNSKIDLDFTTFKSISVMNMEKLQWQKLFIFSNPVAPYFHLIFFALKHSFWTKAKLDQLEVLNRFFSRGAHSSASLPPMFPAARCTRVPSPLAAPCHTARCCWHQWLHPLEPSLVSSPIRSHRLLFSLFGRSTGAPTTVFLPIADSEAGALLCYSFFVSSSDFSSSPVSGTSPSTPHAENRRLRSLERHCTGHRKGYRRRRPPRVKWNRHHSLILVVASVHPP
jgi:hypothetical protein